MSLFPADPPTKSVAHYVISHTAPEKLGAVRLNKVMWHADIAHYRRFGRSITGQSSYVRMPHGPVPNFMKECIEELKAEGKILERAVETQVGARREFVWVEKAPPSSFTPDQIEILHEAMEAVCRTSAREASDHTHDALWAEIEDGRQFPIRAASVSPGLLEASDIEWALNELEPSR